MHKAVTKTCIIADTITQVNMSQLSDEIMLRGTGRIWDIRLRQNSHTQN